MRLKLIIIFLLVVAAALTAIYWKVDRDFFADKLLWNEAQSRSQLSALTRSIESELEAFSQILDLSFPTLQNSKADYGADQAVGRFQMIAQISDQNGDWKLQQKYFLEGTSVKTWAASYIYLALKSHPPGTDRSNELLTLLDPKRKAWVLFVTTSHLTQNHYVALLPADALQAIVDRQKGQMSTLAILNNQTQVLAHTTNEYIGSLFKEDPMVQEFTKNGNASGSGIYVGIKGEKVHGFYEAVQGSNLFVTITTPLKALMAERSKIKIRFLFMGMGISLIGVAMLMLLGDREGDAYEPAFARTIISNPVAATVSASTAAIPAKPIPSVMPGPPLPPAPPAKVTVEPPVPARKIKTDSDKRFEAMFNDRKIQETLAMIDNLEAPPMPPPFPSSPVTEAKQQDVATAINAPALPAAADNTVLDEPVAVAVPTFAASESTLSERSQVFLPPIPDLIDSPKPALPPMRPAKPPSVAAPTAALVAEPKTPAMPPPLSIEKIIEKPLAIQLQRKASKLDQLKVEIRKPGQKANGLEDPI